VRRAYANGRLKHTKTRLSTRAVPLQAVALAALDRLPPSQSSLLFPNARGRHIDFRSFGRRHWQTARVAAGIEPLRHLYDLRHTYATFALRAGVSVFAVSRFMGSSIAMIDRHYGHSPATAANTPSRSWMPSRLKEPWPLGGRRIKVTQSRSATAIPRPAESGRGELWTFGGRRGAQPSSRSRRKGAEEQQLS